MVHDGAKLSAAFSSNGKYLAMGALTVGHGYGFGARAILILEACARLTRNLTRDEWRQHLGDEPYRKTCSNLAQSD